MLQTNGGQDIVCSNTSLAILIRILICIILLPLHCTTSNKELKKPWQIIESITICKHSKPDDLFWSEIENSQVRVETEAVVSANEITGLVALAVSWSGIH